MSRELEMLREWCDAADNGETCRSIDLRAILHLETKETEDA